MSRLLLKSSEYAVARAAIPRLFFLELNAGRIHSMNTDGSDRKTMVSDCHLPDGIVVDADAGHIYWTNMGIPSLNDGSVERADFASIGTLARITDCDVPQLGILHVKTEGGTRFQVQSHAVTDLGLVVGQVTPLAPEPTMPLPEAYQPLAALLELLIDRVGRENFATAPVPLDASWVGYRLAEMLPLPLPIKQSMLEINDCDVRLKVIAQFLKEKEIL
jgi:hypothetical protein